MALTKVTGQVINTSTDVTVGVLTVTNTLAVGGTVSIGGTLTYEDVTNIDSVGLITARNGIVVGSGITLSKDGDGFFTGIVTASSFGAVSGTTGTFTGNVLLTTDNTSIRIGADEDLQIWHDNSNGHLWNQTGSLYLYNSTQNGNVYIQARQGEDSILAKPNGAVELYHDNSKKFETESSGCKIDGSLELTANLVMSDNDKIRLGNSQDLEIYHDGSNSFIKHDGTGALWLYADEFNVGSPDGNHLYIKGVTDGAASLYYDNSRRLETFDLGIDIGTSATANFGIRWGGASYNYCNIWSEHGSGDLFLAGGLKPISGSAGFVSSYGDSFTRNAIQINAFGNSGIQFYASAAQNVAKDSAITVNEIARITPDGLTFGGQSSSSHALHDYEKGSWTPTIYAHLGGGSFTYSSEGRYVKVGHLVHVSAIISWSGTGGSGVVNLGGIPFSTHNTSANNVAVTIGIRTGWSYPRLAAQMAPSGYINVQYIDSNSPYNSFNVSPGAVQSSGSIYYSFSYEAGV